MDERLDENRESIEEDKNKNEKKRTTRKRIAGYMELASAIILTVLSAGLFLNTRGTRLLYVSVTAGRVSRHYGIFLLAAAVLGVIGLVTLRSLHRQNCAGEQQGVDIFSR